MEQSIYRQMRELEDRHWWFAGRRRIVSHLLGSLDLGRTPRILDAGCGTGGNLDMLSRFGCVVGLESDLGAAEMARARGVADVVLGHLPDAIPFAVESFDLVVLLDVLEHIEDETAALKCAAALLAPGGFLVLTVPAFPRLWSVHDEAHHHKRRYVAAGLRAVIEQARFRVCRMSYFNSLLFPAIAGSRLIRRLIARNERQHDLTLPAPWINGLLKCVFGSERRLVDRVSLPFGVSLLAVAFKERP